jgi:hypothetical protein
MEGLFETELMPIPGIEDVLEKITHEFLCRSHFIT